MLSRFNRLLWDPFLLIVLCGAGIYFTILFRFVQVRRFGAAWRQALSRKSGGPGVSPFQALAAAVSAQIGAGNLAGAAAAISAGGPGAVFWMWASAFLGMASAYAEALMAQKYNVRRRGQVVGGPAYYIQAAFPGLAGRCLAGVFALLMVFALGFIGAMVQANTIGESFGEAFGLPPLSAGLATAALCLPVFLGGMERMASFSAKLAPIMTGLYLLGAFFALASRRQLILPALQGILLGAFRPQALAGGLAGVTVKKAFRLGVSRGLFSNEAGMGSAPHAHALARADHPAQQGYVAMLGVFIDTFIVLTLTALVILTSGVYTPGGPVQGAALTQAGFSVSFGSFGAPFIALCLFFFAYSSILGWHFFGAANLRFLFGNRGLGLYQAGACLCILLGAVTQTERMWELTDLCMGLAAPLNLLALLRLAPQAAALTRDYDVRLACPGSKAQKKRRALAKAPKG